MTDDANVTVEVETESEPETHDENPAPVDSGDTVVITQPAPESENVPPVLAEFMAEMRERMGRLEERHETVAETADDAHATATGANDAVNSAVQDVQQIADDVVATVSENEPVVPPEMDLNPRMEHRWFVRKRRSS